MSPKTLSAMPKSPAGGGGARRSSSGSSSLRPVLPFGLDDGSAVEEEEGEELGMGPMPTGRTAPFAAGEGGKGVDEVEVSWFIYSCSPFTDGESAVHVWGVIFTRDNLRPSSMYHLTNNI